MEHLKYLSWANFAFALIGVLTLGIVLLAGLIMIAAAVSSGGDSSQLVVSVVATGVGALIGLLLTGVYVVAGRQVARGRGRILQTILAVLSVGSFPIGTLYALYGLWVCWMNEETKAVFDEPYGLVPE